MKTIIIAAMAFLLGAALIRYQHIDKGVVVLTACADNPQEYCFTPEFLNLRR